MPLRMRAAAEAAGAGTLSPGTAAGPLVSAGASPVPGAAGSPVPAVQAGPAGMAYPPNFGASGFEQYDALYHSLQNQIVAAQRSLPLDPDHLEQHQARIAQLTESYIKTLSADPRQQAMTAGMKKEAEERERRIELRGPGAAAFDAHGRVLAQSPQPVDSIDPVTGARNRTWAYPAVAGTAAAQPAAPSAPPTQAGTPSPGIGPAQPGQGIPTELGPGQKISLEDRAKLEQTAREDTLKAADAAQYQQATLNRMKDDTEYFYTGPGAELRGKMEAYLRLINPAFDKPVESREDFIKNAGALTRQATREASPRAAFQEMQFINSTLPNIEMSPKGLNAVISEYQGLNDYRIAKAKLQADWEMEHGGVGHIEGFESDFAAKHPVTPYTFIIQRMSEDDQNELIRKWQGTAQGQEQLKRFKTQLQFAAQKGLLSQ